MDTKKAFLNGVRSKRAETIAPDVQPASQGTDDDPIISGLKKALATEYLAYHMYRSAYYMCRGEKRIDITPELWTHADEELDHAGKLEDRIQVLGGFTFHSPVDWVKWSPTPVPEIVSSDIPAMLDVIEQSERDAIKVYSTLLDICASDLVTRRIVIKILEKEQEHLFDVVEDLKGGK